MWRFLGNKTVAKSKIASPAALSSAVAQLTTPVIPPNNNSINNTPAAMTACDSNRNSSSSHMHNQMRFNSSKAEQAKRDFYEVLGVPKSATEAQLKKAYREKAMKHHPDRGGDKDEFSAISEAYEVLSNDDKRRVYDQYGHEAATSMGQGGPGGFGGRSAEDIFSEFFGGAGFGGRSQQRRQQEESVDVKLKVTLEDVFNGSTKPVRVKRRKTCGDCRGEGTNKPGSKVSCTACNGQGRVMRQIRMGPGMIQQTIEDCSACNSTGKSIKREDRCKGCKGVGTIEPYEEISIPVPAGCPDGACLVISGQGHQGVGVIPGDLNIHIEVQKHPKFEVKGSDLLYQHTITLSEALLGVELRLPLLDGRETVIRSEPGKPLKNGSVLSIAGKGLPKHQQPGSSGSLYITINVRMPEKLTQAQQAAIEEHFGAPRRDENVNKSTVATAKVLSNTFEELARNKEREWSGQSAGAGARQRRASAGGSGGGQQAQCQQM